MTKSPSRLRLLAALAIVVALPAIIGGTWAGLTGTTQTIDNRWASITILPPQNTTPPQITAGPGVDTAQADPGAWDGDPTSFAFQWQRCDATGSSCQNVPGAASATYAPAGLDDVVAARFRVQVTASTPAGHSTVASAPTVRPSITPTTPPALTGTPTAGQTLTLTSGTWAIDDTPGAVTYLRWERCDTSGENCVPRQPSTPGVYTTDPVLALTSQDTGHRIRVIALRVAPTGQGIRYAEQVANDLSATIGQAPVNTGPPEVRDSQDAQITGSPFVADTLRASTGTWANQPTSYTYQWERCDTTGSNCSQIDGATAETYQLANGDYGHRIRVAITASNAHGQTSEISPATGIVAVRDPINTNPPTISGSTVVGGTLNATTGTWLGSNLTYAYQWQRCDRADANCTAIAGATSNNYIATQADSGTRLRVRVIATQNARSSQATSTPVGPISNPSGWTYATPMPLGRAQFVSEVLRDGRVIVAGGTVSGSGSPVASASIYNPTTDTWASAGSMSTGRLFSGHASVVLDDGKALIVGGDTTGATTTPSASTDIFDPASGTWSTGASLHTARLDHSLVKLADGRVMAIGGSNGSATLASTEIYNPETNTWTNGPPMNSPRQQAAATMLPSGKVLVAGGFISGGSFLASSEAYDPRTNTWTSTGSTPAAQADADFVLRPDGSTWLLGGASATGNVADVASFDGSGWTTRSPLGVARMPGIQAVPTANGTPLVVGGGRTTPLQSVERLSGTGAWAFEPSLQVPRSRGVAHSLPSGRVLAIGGHALDSMTTSQTATVEYRDYTPWQAPAPTVAPTATGTPQVGSVLQGVTGSWDGYPTRIAPTWQRCDAALSTCSTIPASGSDRYTIRPDDVGARLRVRVVAENPAGRVTSYSTATPPITARPTYTDVITSQGAMAYWRVNETSGTTMADSAGAYPGTFANVTLGQIGALGDGSTAAAFNGSSSYATAASTPITATDSFTVSMWVRPGALPASNTPAYLMFRHNGRPAYYEGYALAVFNGKFVFLLASDAAGQQYVEGGTPTIGEWQHVAAVYDRAAGQMRLYVNGAKVAEANRGADLQLAPTPTYLGRSGQNTEGWYNGRLDEIAMFRTALSSTQILAQYNTVVSSG